ncbi:MAG: NAD(P)/FAD-dependent oxidoreductase [Mycobacteriales bacterium]
MVSVLVVGAGIIGTALADRLAGEGVPVTLVDSGDVAAGTTRTSTAWLNSNHKRPRSYHDFNVAGMAAWQELAGGFGTPGWYAPTGHLAWGGAEIARRVEELRAWDYPAELISADEAAAREPELRVPAGATVAVFPGEAHVLPDTAARALATRAAGNGAVLHIGQEVTTVDGDGVALAGGDRLAADVVVCAAGWRVNELLARSGLAPLALTPADGPDSPAPCLVARTAPSPVTVRHFIRTPGVDLRPDSTGGLALQGADLSERATLDMPPEARQRAGAELLRRARAVLPRLDAELAEAAVCVRPLPADGHPIVGWHPDLPSLYVISTHSGITLAPLLARLATAEIRTRGTAAPELSPYRPERFARASTS